MSFLLTVNSLSALQATELSYSYNSNEKLKFTPVVYSNRIAYNSYDAFDNIQDVALSNKNALFLTGTKSLTSIFEETTSELTLGKISGTIFLNTLSGENVQYDGNTLSVQLSSSNKARITIVPIDNDTVELFTNNGIQLVVDSYYPYTVKASNAVLSPDQQYRRQFKLEYINGLMTFQTNTNEGPRYLSYGVDKVLRAVGLVLNNASINPYLFVPTFITSQTLPIGFDPTSNEVKYYNDIESFKNRINLDIKEKNAAETNLLISCATSDITKKDKTNINIAMLRTNYTSTGTYAPSHTVSLSSI